MTLGKQLHIDYRDKGDLFPELVQHVFNQNFVKGGGGLWTSTYTGETGSDWVQWCLGEHFGVPEGEEWTGYILTPDPAARIVTIDSMEDLKELHKKYPFKSDGPPELQRLLGRHLDYEKLAEDFDGMRVTERGQALTRWNPDLNLYGWDCESTHWFRWKFSEVEKIEKVKFEQE